MIDYEKTEKGWYSYEYPRAAMTTDQVIFGFDGTELKVLLIQRGVEPYLGRWAFPGGFLQMNESLDECAKRELMEETGLTDIYMKQFGVFSDVERDPRGRVVTTAYYSLVRMQDVKGGDDATDAQWFSLKDVPQLAFDHDKILRIALQHLRVDLHFSPVGFELLPEKFTIRQLQTLYEAILDIHFDKRNFTKKMLSTGIIDKTDEKEKIYTNKAAFYYSFNKERYYSFKSRNNFNLEF